MFNTDLRYLLDVDKLSKVVADIYRITGIPTGIIDYANHEFTLENLSNNYYNSLEEQNKNKDSAKQLLKRIVQDVDIKKKSTLIKDHSENILAVPVKLQNRIIAVLYQCNFYIKNKKNQTNTKKNPIPLTQQQLETNTDFLKHFGELISQMADARMKELEVNSKLDLMVQQETVELLKTNEELQDEIAERRQTEKKLRNSEERFRSIFEQSSIGIMIISLRNVLLSCNQAVMAMLGYKIEELRAHEIKDFIYQNDRETIALNLKKLIKNKQENFCLESRFIKKNKKHLWGRITVSMISYDDPNFSDFIVVMMEDITARKQAEKEVQESEKRFRDLFENAPEAVYLFEPDTKEILLANKFTQSFFGYSWEELRKMTIDELIVSNIKLVEKNIQEVLASSRAYIQERRYRKKNGEIVDVDVIATKNKYKGKDCILAFVRDITERKKYEREITKALEKEKELSQLKSNFVSTVSHEFKTPMSVILSSVQLLDRFNEKWEKEKKQKLFQKIYNAVMQTNGLINNVLLMGKDQSGKLEYRPSRAHFEAFCKQIIEETQIIFGSDVRINTSINTNIGEVVIDTNLLRHIFTNLLSNAVKYSFNNKVIDFAVSNTPGGKTSILIKDRGIGISNEELKNIYEPFHRAKNAGHIKGTGLGMSIVKRCVDLHDGKIEIHSELGKGTSVLVTLQLQ